MRIAMPIATTQKAAMPAATMPVATMLIAAMMLLSLTQADASSGALAFSRSYLSLNDTSTASLKSISQSTFFYYPGLYVKGYGEAESAVKSSNAESMIIEQSANFSTISSQHLGMVSSHIQARNLTGLDVSLLGISSAGLQEENNLSLIRSESSSLAMAYPGEGRFAFFLTGGHYLELDFCDLPFISAQTLPAYEFGFRGDELRLDEPLEVFDQRIDLFFALSPDYQSSHAGYSLSRSVENDGIRCQSEMEYGVVRG